MTPQQIDLVQSSWQQVLPIRVTDGPWETASQWAAPPFANRKFSCRTRGRAGNDAIRPLILQLKESIMKIMPNRMRRSTMATFKKRTGWLAAAALVAMSNQAMAESCTPYVANLYAWLADGSAHWYDVQAVRVTTRQGGGFSSFSMGSSYSPWMGISTDPTPANLFFLNRDIPTDTLVGQFQDVFPGRTDGSSDLTTLKIRRSGTVQLRMDDWGGSLVSLTSLQCFPGNAGRAFVMTGRSYSGSWGLDAWSFVIVPAWIG